MSVYALRAKHRHRRAELQTISSCRLLNASPPPANPNGTSKLGFVSFSILP